MQGRKKERKREIGTLCQELIIKALNTDIKGEVRKNK